MKLIQLKPSKRHHSAHSTSVWSSRRHLSGESDRQHEMNETLWHLHTQAGRDPNQLGAAGPFAQLIKSVCKRQTAANACPTNCYCSITVERISWTFLRLAIKDFLEEGIKWKNMIHEVTGEVLLFFTKRRPNNDPHPHS